MVELAANDSSEERPAKGEQIARAQSIPLRFLENIMGELRINGLVHSRRGADGGYWLARPANELTIAEIVRAVEGPLATVHGDAADELEYTGHAAPLQQVWLALRTSVRNVLETTTLANVVAGDLPESVEQLVERTGSPQAR